MRFSIVVANYNSGKLLEECISSVIAQNFNDYELIMVDAGISKGKRISKTFIQKVKSLSKNEKNNIYGE